MKAVILEKNSTLRLVNTPEPSLKKDRALVKVKNCCVCATDLELIAGNIVTINQPIIPGHEWSGVVTSVENSAHQGWVGKRVAGSNDLYCGVCHQCQIGNIRYCNDYKEIGFLENGAYAEYISVPVKNLIELPDNVSFLQGALLEPLGVGLGAVLKAGIYPGANVTVIGMGPIGLNIIAVAKKAGAINIISAAASNKRSFAAKSFGAKYTVSTKDTNLHKFIEKNHPNGSDIIIDATGNAECIQTSFDAVRMGGTVLLAGFGGYANMPITMDTIGIKNLSVIGAGKNWGILPETVGLVADGLDTTSIATHFFPLEDYATALYMAKIRPVNFIKAVFNFED